MHIDLVEGSSGFGTIRRNWESVYAADPEAQFFLSWQWLSDWASVHPTVSFVLAAKHEETDPEYIAFLPLRLLTQFDREHGLLHALQFAGTGFSDYTGILTRPEDEAEAVPAIAEYVSQRLNWARFTMHNLTLSERRRDLFVGAFDKPGFDHTPIEYRNPNEATDHAVCLTISLPANWDDYLNTLSANNRQKIRRMLRKVDASEACRIELSDAASFDNNLTMLLDFWKAKWAPSKGVENATDVARLNHAMLARCAANGTLLLPVFWDGDRPVAALAILIDPCKKSLLFFIAGRDEAYRGMPAGYLLHAYSIRHAIAHGFTTYDFLKGDEPYKYLFAPQQQRRQRAVVVATTSGRNLTGKLDPRALSAMLEIALELQDQGETADAERCYRQILEVAPDHALALYRFGRLMAGIGDHGTARELFSRSLAAEPDGDNAWFCLAQSLQALGEDQVALAACGKAVELQPENEAARDLLRRLSTAAASQSLTATLWPIIAADWAPAPPRPQVAAVAAADRERAAQEIHNQICEYLDAFVVPAGAARPSRM